MSFYIIIQLIYKIWILIVEDSQRKVFENNKFVFQWMSSYELRHFEHETTIVLLR